jgi:6-pyruvoyl-tetrahydropterin synthase related domain
MSDTSCSSATIDDRAPDSARGGAGPRRRRPVYRLEPKKPARVALQCILPLGLAVLPALWAAWPLLWKTPLSHDHATHLFKAWHFWEEMLGRGRLRGWSHFWGFGTPSDELVPFGSELWVALFRVATLGQLSWLRTYALAFAGLLILNAVTAFTFARIYLGPAAAVVCAWLTLLDPGAYLEGGWDWQANWGVWPVTLAMSLVLACFTQLERVLQGGRARHVFLAGSCCAASLLTHPMALLALGICVPLLLCDHVLRPNGLEPGRACRALGALAFGVALASFYLVPFLARSAAVQDLGSLGDSLPAVSRKLVQLRTFQNVSGLVHGLALLGAWSALRRRLPGALFLASAGGVLVLLSSGVLIRDLHLERVLPSLIKIEANRFLLVAKSFWFALAGHGAVMLARPPIGADAATSRWRSWTGRVLGAALGLALVVPGWRHFYDTQIAKTLIGEQERQYFADFQQLFEWTRQQRLATHEHYRVAYHMPLHEHLATLAPVFDGSLMYKVGYTPVQIYDKLPMTSEPELLEALSVKYVVSAYPLDLPLLTEEKRFGELRLYRFQNYRPEPFSIIGPGKGELLEFSPERVRIRLSDTGPDSRLQIHVASFDRWQATSAGDVLPISTVPVFGAEYPILMEVPARDGDVELSYVYRSIDWVGLLLTLTAVPAFAAACWLARRHRFAPRSAEQLRRFARPLGWGAVLLMLSLAGAAAAGTRTRERLLPEQSIFRRVQAPGQMTLGAESCIETAPATFQCGRHRVIADVVAGEWGLHLCMTAPDAGDLRVRAPTRLGSFLAGHYDPVKEGPGSISVSVDGTPLGTVSTRPASLRQQRIQFDTRNRRHEQALVEVVLSGTARNCFDLEVQD